MKVAPTREKRRRHIFSLAGRQGRRYTVNFEGAQILEPVVRLDTQRTHARCYLLFSQFSGFEPLTSVEAPRCLPHGFTV